MKFYNAAPHPESPKTTSQGNHRFSSNSLGYVGNLSSDIDEGADDRWSQMEPQLSEEIYFDNRLTQEVIRSNDDEYERNQYEHEYLNYQKY
jgi:hypothetical protein